MKIVDTHVHIYPDAIADKASNGIGTFYGIEMRGHGRISEVLDSMHANGIYKSVVCSVATNKHQVCKINDFMSSQLSVKEFHPLATLHPDMDKFEIADEVERIKHIGLKGIKLHPDCQAFKLSGDRGLRLFDSLGDFDLPILVHVGDRRFDFSHPEYMIEVAKDFPHLKFIAAHFGGWTEWDQALRYKGLRNVWFDTSSSLFKLDAHIAKTVMFGLGIEKFMYGTDSPVWQSDIEIGRVLALELGQRNNELVFHKNAEKLFGIEETV